MASYCSQADLDLLVSTSQEALAAKDRVIRSLLSEVDGLKAQLASQADKQQLDALREQAAACSRDANEHSAQLVKAKKALQKALTTVKERTDAINAAHAQIAALKKQLAEAQKAKSPAKRGKQAAVLAENQGAGGADTAEAQRLAAENARLSEQLAALRRAQRPAAAEQACREAEQLATEARSMHAAVGLATARIEADAADLAKKKERLVQFGRWLVEQSQTQGRSSKKQPATREQIEHLVGQLSEK